MNRPAERIVRDTERRVMKHYADKLNSLRSTLSKYFARYEEEGVLTYEQMVKYDRLAKLEKELFGEMNELYQDNGTQIRRMLRETYKEAYYRKAWELETMTRAKLGYSFVKPEVVKRAIQNPISGLTLNERLSRNRADVILRLKEQLTQGLVQGESYRKIAGRVKEIVEKDTYSAMRIVRTESGRVYNSGEYDSVTHAAKQGVELAKVWIASSDDRTRESHEDLDGKRIPVDEEFKINGFSALYPGDFGVAKEDIHCRCTVGYEVVALDKPEDDSLSNMDYDTWKTERLH